jgi:UDPglucose 6-dehydrogenase
MAYINKGLRQKVSVIGCGVVGTATGKGFQKLGHDVYFYDISKQRLDSLASEGLRTTDNIVEALSKTQISFICVNTPTNEQQDDTAAQDLSQLRSVLHDLAVGLEYLHKKKSNQSNHGSTERKRQADFKYLPDRNRDQVTRSKFPRLLVFKSTILPGTMRNVVLQYLETQCSLRIGRDYNVFYNPEFLRENYALHDFFNMDRVIIGEDDIALPGNSSAHLQALYRPLTQNIIVTNYETAELIKYAANCFLSLKISYFNEIGIICRSLGIDDNLVSHAVSLDKRIRSYGTRAGRPFEGACLPKDTKAFAAFVKEKRILPLGTQPDLLRSTLEINRLMIQEHAYKHQERKPFQISSTAKISYTDINVHKQHNNVNHDW